MTKQRVQTALRAFTYKYLDLKSRRLSSQQKTSEYYTKSQRESYDFETGYRSR